MQAPFWSCVLRWCVLLRCPPSPRADVADYLGKPVTSVRLVLDGRDTTEPALVQVVETRPGDPLSMLDVRESVTHLFSLGRFDDVRVDAGMEGAGVALRYELTPIHVVSKIEFAGNLAAPGVDVGQLRRAVVDRYGSSPPLGRINELSLAIADTLRQRGYRRPEVSPRVDVDRGSQRATLVFSIDPGPRTTIGTVAVAGTPMMSPEEFLDRLGLAAGDPYEPEALNTRIASYVDARRARGYYQARVDAGRQLLGRRPRRQPDADGRRRARTSASSSPAIRCPAIRAPRWCRSSARDRRTRTCSRTRATGSRSICARRDTVTPARLTRARKRTASCSSRSTVQQEVRRYRVGAVEISGGASLPAARIFETSLRTRVGEPYSDANLDADVTAIESVYRGRGFVAARVQADPRPQPATADGRRFRSRSAFSSPKASGRWSARCASRAMPRFRKRRFVRRSACSLERRTSTRSCRRDIDAIQLEYANRGYRSATVQAQPGFTAGSRAGESRLHRPRGPAGLRRSHSDRRQRSHERRDDRARASAQAGRSAQPRGGVRKPAAAGGASAVPPRAAADGTAPRRRDAGATCW